MSFSYYASQLTDNIGETPEGYLVCKDAIVGRSGYQTYEVRDLPADAARELGVDVSNPTASIELYRSPEEVFSPATIASFEGKSVCDGHPPASQFVDPSNVADYEYGHVQNVRRGDVPLESGEWPLIADLIIKREPLLSRVRSKQTRELSCGYDYTLARDGDRIVQTLILGNHVAVVPRGRAGAEARIKDSASEPKATDAPTQKPAGDGGNPVKEKPRMKGDLLKRIMGLGFKAFAADAEPEEVAEAAEAMKKAEKKEEKAADATPPPEEKKPPVEEKKPPVEEKKPAPADDKKPAHDFASRRADDSRNRMHDMIRGCDEADLSDLEEHLENFFGEEEGSEQAPEPTAEDAATDKGPRKVRDAKAADQFIAPIDDKPAAQPAATDATLEILRALRPVIARSNDAAVKRAFNGLLGAHTRKPGASNGSYSEVAAASRLRAADAETNNESDRDRKLQAGYDAVRTGNKQEVK